MPEANEKTWLDEMGVTMDDALRLARELLERCPGTRKGLQRINFCRNLIAAGSREIQEAAMRKEETTEQAVKRLVRKCGQAVDKLYSRIDDKAAAYDNMGEIVKAVEELAQLALQAERRDA